ncbi:MAG: hypothetical protein BVN29_18285 [Nitrospira sp. ST-bin5]|nr:MAG: hypothetical protein BVN29_18285 [Nitrospira sp. ST-bin5]
MRADLCEKGRAGSVRPINSGGFDDGTTQDHTKEKVKGPGTGWKDRQKAAGVRRDAQLSALTQMIRGLAGDCLRLPMKCKILADVLAKKWGSPLKTLTPQRRRSPRR